MLRGWLKKKLLFDDHSPREQVWKFTHTKDMFHPVLAESLDDNFRIIEGSEFPTHIEEVVSGCFVFPLFSKKYCDFLCSSGDANGRWGKVTGDPYTAFEISLFKLSPSIYKYHRDIVCMTVLNNVLAGLLNGYNSKILQNSFIIKYTLETCKKMDMHYDQKSLVSLSVNLNDGYDGGGLSFVREPTEIVNPKTGYAAMFAGNPFSSHKALPITTGNRFVLVYWMR